MKKLLSCLFATTLLVLGIVMVGCNGCSKEKDRTSYHIECTLNNDKLTGVQTVEFYNSFENAISTLKFNLFANAFRQDATYKPISSQYLSKAYKYGESYGSIKIINCFQNDEKLDFKITGQDSNVLEVTLKEEVFPLNRVTIKIEYQLTLANVVARTGINDSTINLANFYPILCAYDENGFYECLYYSHGDPYFSDCADYFVSITLDKEYCVASSGKITKSKVENNLATHIYSLENARSFAMVISKQFESIKTVADGVDITYYYYKDSNPAKSLDYAQKSLKLFSEKFGEYPYPTYSVVQTEFIQGGMEFPALVMISDALEEKAYGEVIVHETAHQWWQTVVGNNEVEYSFLDEGLSEYSVVLFYEKYPEEGLNRQIIIDSCEKQYRMFCSVIDKLDGKVNTSMVRGLGDFYSEYEYVNIAYIKPCIMYDYLRKSIGDEKFFKGLRKYYNDYSFKNAIPDDLVGSFEKTGADTNGFFDSFFSGKVII